MAVERESEPIEPLIVTSREDQDALFIALGFALSTYTHAERRGAASNELLEQVKRTRSIATKLVEHLGRKFFDDYQLLSFGLTHLLSDQQLQDLSNRFKGDRLAEERIDFFLEQRRRQNQPDLE